MSNEIVAIKEEINKQLTDAETVKTLLSVTFKGFEAPAMKRALLEGRMRGFQFTDFLEKNVYAIKYGEGYNLVTSIDYARKIGMRSGVNGKSEPTYTETKEGQIETCSVTVYRKDGHPSGYTAKVYFKEYTTGRNLWISKPRTMIAKVAEMHALRMACPEEMSQMYVEEERAAETAEKIVALDITDYETKLRAAKTMDELKTAWANIPAQAKQALQPIKSELKTRYENA